MSTPKTVKTIDPSNGTQPTTNSPSINSGTITWTYAPPPGGYQTISIPYGNPIAWDNAPAIKKKSDKDGCTCKKCTDFCQFAEANQKDGSFLCYKCRKGY